MPEGRIKVIRTLVYEGTRSWVEGTLERSYIRPDKEPFVTSFGTITELPREIEEVKENG